MPRRSAAPWLALALLVVGARAVSLPPFTAADVGTGTAEPANCTWSADAGGAGGDMEASWLEITEVLNFTQYKNKAGADFSLMPDPLPFPFTLSASDYKAPGWIGTCISRSPNAPADCEGDDCNVYIEEWDVEWLEFALLKCYGSYPTPGVNFFTNPEPGPGNVALCVTQTCKNYFYGPNEQWDFFYSVTDQWGNKWAMQTTHQNVTTEEGFDALLAEVVWPQGWQLEKVKLNATMTHVPFMVGNACYAMVIKDSEFNSWHLYDYPADGFSKNGSLLGAMGNTCERLDAQYTLSGMAGAGTPAPAPEPTATTSHATALPAAAASAMALAALTAAAAMLF